MEAVDRTESSGEIAGVPGEKSAEYLILLALHPLSNSDGNNIKGVEAATTICVSVDGSAVFILGCLPECSNWRAFADREDAHEVQA